MENLARGSSKWCANTIKSQNCSTWTWELAYKTSFLRCTSVFQNTVKDNLHQTVLGGFLKMQILGSLEQESTGKGPEVCMLANFPGEPRAASVCRSSGFFNLLSQCDVQKKIQELERLRFEILLHC